jgi:hypothetical protein
VERTVDALQEGGEGLDLLGGGTVEHDGRQVEQHAVEDGTEVVAALGVEVEQQRGRAVLQVLQRRLVGGGVVDDLERGPHVPGTDAGGSARRGAALQVGRLADRGDVDPVERGAGQRRPHLGVRRVLGEAAGLAQHGGGRDLPRRDVVRVVVAHEPQRALGGLQLLGLGQAADDGSFVVGHERRIGRPPSRGHRRNYGIPLTARLRTVPAPAGLQPHEPGADRFLASRHG